MFHQIFGMPVVQMERKIDEISDFLEKNLKDRIDEFGVKMKHLDIGAIEIDKESEAYLQVKGLTGDITAKTMHAQADLNIQNLKDTQALNMENMKETMRIQREEGQCPNICRPSKTTWVLSRPDYRLMF